MYRNRLWIYSLGLFILLLSFGGAFAEDTPTTPGRLTLQEAIEIALNHHPSLLAARGELEIQQARVGEARANFLPQLKLQSDYSRATANPTPSTLSGSLTRTDPSNKAYNNYSAGLALQQLIFDFGKTGAAVESARENLRGSDLSEVASRQTVSVNVKVAYFGLLAARRLVQVEEETVRQFQQHLEQVEGFYKAGTR
ncbi:MAG: TolC family protein, partial [Nitrospirae bacterium]|nr:TolC family protein [Nitrospirota bacterium]